MKIKILPIFIAIVSALASFKPFINNECIEQLFKETNPALKTNYNKRVVHEEVGGGKMHLIDSVNYEITRRWTKKRKPVVETISNTLTNIDKCKTYNDKGVLEEEGYRSSYSQTKIGVWKFLSKRMGKMDSIIDYDKIYKVSFCEFYKICEEKGMLGRRSTIRFDSPFRKWIANQLISDSPNSIELSLQVDSMVFRQRKVTGHW